MRSWFRWLFKICMDCGVKLPPSYNRGDVCKKCFDEFNGLTIDEIVELFQEDDINQNQQ